MSRSGRAMCRCVVAFAIVMVALSGCMSTTITFGADGRVAEIHQTNLMRVGTAVLEVPPGGGASVATTAQAMSDQMAGVLGSGISKIPSPLPLP